RHAGSFQTLLRLRLRLRLGRVVASFALEEARIVQEAGNAVGRQCANREPMLRTLKIKHDALGIVLRQQRVGRADLLDEATIAGAARIGDHDAVEGTLLCAATGEPDLQSHLSYLSSGPAMHLCGPGFRQFLRLLKLNHFFFLPEGSPGRPGGIPPKPEPGRPGNPFGSPPGGSFPSAPPSAPDDSACCNAFGSAASGGRSGIPPPPPNSLERRPPFWRPIAFIMSAIWRCILRRRLISCTSVPDPLAMRFLRLALRSFGFSRSLFVMDETMAI